MNGKIQQGFSFLFIMHCLHNQFFKEKSMKIPLVSSANLAVNFAVHTLDLDLNYS